MKLDFPSNIDAFLDSIPLSHQMRRLLIPSATPAHEDRLKPASIPLDGGLARLRKTVRATPTAESTQTPDPAWREIKRLYAEQLLNPLFPVQQAPVICGHLLTPPRIDQAFIPQAYRVIRHTTNDRHYSDENHWETHPIRSDLGRFLYSWLLSDYAITTPLVIIGPTGAGKTFLIRMLAGHLSAPAFHPVRLVLGSVDARATIQNQIEEQLRLDLGRKLEWGPLSRSVRDRHPVVLLDGMNDLLGAHERVFRDYPEKARRFQELEASLGRPVRLILTSRTEVIDRADLPVGAVVLRLEPFDANRRDRWIRLWNRANRAFFRASGVRPLQLPEETPSPTWTHIPFHLSLLAILDADGNPLREIGPLTRAVLYQQITQRFVARTLPPGTPSEVVHSELQRLGAAAVGMFHRRAMSIRADELQSDALFLVPAPAGVVSHSPALPPLATTSSKLLEQLFFVQVEGREKRGRTGNVGREKEPLKSYSFWHAAFGEFLTADYLLRLTRDEVLRICRERRGRNRAIRKLAEERFRNPSTTPELWLATLIHTPLFDRPGILSMLRERAKGCWFVEKGERGTGIDPENFLLIVDEMIQGQLHWILQGNTPPPLMTRGQGPWVLQLPLLGYLAVYSLNLIILRSVLDPAGWIFDEGAHAGGEDGVPAWDRLTHLWRSWFSSEHLARLRGILKTRRLEGRMHIQSLPEYTCVRGVQGTLALFELARVLADEEIEQLISSHPQGTPSNPTP
ncbi:MAG: ATP-binding protein [Magnetococcus sp. YQC-9]